MRNMQYTINVATNENMNQNFPQVYLARHGETSWAITGRHAGLTDVPLTLQGEENARSLGKRLKGLTFCTVFSSPLQRAWRTCELAGFGKQAIAEQDIIEWNYGDYEGKTTPEIHQQRPDWEVFKDGCPAGESVRQVAARADRMVTRVRVLRGDVLLFAHNHFLRMFAVRWMRLQPEAGRCFFLNTASLSIVGYEHGLNDPVIRLWNDKHHLETTYG